MRILIVGSGGREHALVRALTEQSSTATVYAAPGNPGTALAGTNVPIPADDREALVRFAQAEAIDLTIVGPEQPLVAGLVDAFEEARLAIVGPTAAAAQLEGSKAFAKDFMQRHDVPTADFRTFTADAYNEAAAYLDEIGAPVVVKASGLAGGKGAIVCDTLEKAHEALSRVVQDRDFGAAGDRVVIEAFMEGEEASIFALTDGEHYVLLNPSQDHKAIGERGTGPNTGGMGAYAPAPVVTGRLLNEVCRTIIEPTLSGMASEGTPYRGVLYAGLMITDAGPKVVEFNCRLGDPEAQVVLPLIDTDMAQLFLKLTEGRLHDVSVRGSDQAAACVVVASEGYPVSYEKGFPITGIDEAEAVDGVHIIHSGTRRADDGSLVTDGGRVLGVTAQASTLSEAIQRAYDGVGRIHFKGKTYRRDIGEKGLAHLKS